MMHKIVFAAAAVAILAGCSSRPREFSPVLAVPAADQTAFNAAVAECGTLLAGGKLNSQGRLASGAAGVAVSGATLAAGTAAASTAGIFGGLAVAGATIVLLPFAAIGGAYGMAKAKQRKKELAIDGDGRLPGGARPCCRRLAAEGEDHSGQERRRCD